MGKFSADEVKLMKENRASRNEATIKQGSYLWAFLAALAPLVLQLLVNHINLFDPYNAVLAVVSFGLTVFSLNQAYIKGEKNGLASNVSVAKVNQKFSIAVFAAHFFFAASSPAHAYLFSALATSAVTVFTQ